MIIDKLENIGMYASVNPLFAQAIEFLKSTDLNAHEPGKVVLKEGELFVNFAAARPKTKDDAKIETHNNFGRDFLSRSCYRLSDSKTRYVRNLLP